MKKIFTLLVLQLMVLSGCVDTLDDYNTDLKRAATVPAGTLFTGAVKTFTDLLTTPDVNTNNFRLYAQYWTTTTYLDEPRYSMTSRLYSQNFWQTVYRNVLGNLNESKRLIEEDAVLDPQIRNNQLAQIHIMEAMAWSALVNTFGNVPYSEALDPEVSLPRYDDAAAVYDDILAMLDQALASFTPGAAGLGSADPLYNGDVEKWIRFGNSLKLRLAMFLADVNPSKAKALVEQAAPNVFASNADNARFPYLNASPNQNPVASQTNPLFTSRQDFVVASTIVDAMAALADPRMPYYFTKVGDTYVGGNYGFANDFSSTSKPSDKITAPGFEALLLDYAEVQFLLAEAAERGFTVSQTAEVYYSEAVTASVLYWGGTVEQAENYLAQPEVQYATAAGNYKEKIGVQKWIAFFNRGWDGWNEWKRLDYPALQPPSGGGISTQLAIPVRMIYPINEQTLNGKQREAAAAAIGSDAPTTKLFWDKF
jgi:hypothetical protein